MKCQAEEIFENSILPNQLQDLPNSAGLVLFTDEQNSPISLLTTANIKRVAENKLAEQVEKSKRTDLKSITAKIYYTVCRCKFRLGLKHLDAVKKIFGQNYKDYITLVWPWFLVLNTNKNIPFFHVTKKPSFEKNERILGPFPTQKSASIYLNTLQDVFKLCRRSDLAENQEKAKSCPYLQMDACVGVCTGKVRCEEYKNIIENAFTAGTEPAAAINNFQEEMQTAAKELNFEKAAMLKKKIDKLAILKKQSYKWTNDLKNLKIIHIDKSDKIKPESSKIKKQTYAIFIMNGLQIIDAGDFLPDNPETINNVINKNIASLSDLPDDDMLERFSIVTYFLYRSKPAGVWIKNENNFDFAAAAMQVI